eukprot:Tamp_32604.p2 GENE.Tamp_32604~~Tamp_32604.p2  ORF type:complete len:115 (-),score=8.88 Tamp_32604:106-450(-)
MEMWGYVGNRHVCILTQMRCRSPCHAPPSSSSSCSSSCCCCSSCCSSSCTSSLNNKNRTGIRSSCFYILRLGFWLLSTVHSPREYAIIRGDHRERGSSCRLNHPARGDGKLDCP